MFQFIKKLFGTAQSRQIKKYAKGVSLVNAQEKIFQELSDEEIVLKTEDLKQRYHQGESLENLLPEAYGLVKNACRRLYGTAIHVSGYDQKWDMIPYDVQILGAIAMFHGAIAEMQTGEGKTLTASLPLFLYALSGKPVHLVTVNDYLAKRDCEWIGTVFRKLGLSVTYLTNDIPPYKRKEVYQADIVYGTASEFGFDYLRDNSMAMNKREQVQRGHFFAIIDEIDSILIDEARTPLIISGPVAESNQMYEDLQQGVSTLVESQKSLCRRLANDAKKTLDSLKMLTGEALPKLDKKEQVLAKEAFRTLWLVGKGTPRNKTLKRIRENPDLRAEIEKWETYFCSQQNKEERAEVLSDLYIIVDERANEHELTDKGIHLWCEKNKDTSGEENFLMLDLGHEYAKIDSDTSLSKEAKLEKKLAVRSEDAKRKERSHNLRQLFRAHLLMEKDVDYIVQDNKIIIIDENTGRPQPGRRFSDGLHQSIEAKEAVEIQGETQTYATITLQNYFRMYDKLAGMTGTAMTEATEFKELYKLEVLEIPTYRPSNRKDQNDEIYMTEREKYHAILEEIKKVHGKGQPILIGTESVEVSEKLSRVLKQNGLKHSVLNAKNHELEAEIIADAGKKSSITLATNMAGRGTDIKLQEGVAELGGLHVIGTTRHNSRRIDRQLRGRSGRLGDPGSTKFFISFEDSLMRLFASPRMTSLLQRFRPPEGEPISAKVLNKSIETAQKRVEQRNYTTRKHTLEYDDVMNKQRQEVYSFRNEILTVEKPLVIAKELLEEACISQAEKHFAIRLPDRKWDTSGFCHFLTEYFPIKISEEDFEDLDFEDAEKLAYETVLKAFETKIDNQTELLFQLRSDIEDKSKILSILNEVVRHLMLQKIDHLWKEHLLVIDHLREDVHLRVVGQKDPLMEFKHEAFLLFDQFSQNLKLGVCKDLFRFEMIPPQEDLQQQEKKIQLHTHKSYASELENTSKTKTPPEGEKKRLKPKIISNKIGRNENCPCGSGKKHKKCCGSALV